MEPTTLLISGDPRDHARARGGYVIGLINQINVTGNHPDQKTREARSVRPGQPI